MSVSTVILVVILSNVAHGFEQVHRSTKKVYYVSEAKKNEAHGEGNVTLRKYKRWIPSVQDISLDYPELDDSFGDTQLAEVVKPFGPSVGPGNVFLYRPGSQRPHGALTRTTFNPPSGLIPRMIAAAKAAFATLTGPQTILSRTTYLRPPRPAITAVLPHGFQSPVASSDQGPQSANAATAAAAAAAAVAAITRSLYEVSAQRGNGFIIDKSNPHLPPPRTYSPYGVWTEPPRLSWNSYQPDPPFRFPQEPYGYQSIAPQLDHQTYLSPSSYLPYGYRNPSTERDIYIEPPRNTWYDTSFNNQRDKSYGGRDNSPVWDSYGNIRSSWSQDRQHNRKDIWTERKTSFGRSPGGFGGFAEASADTPPNGDSYADAKVTPNGASAVAAAVWSQGSLDGMRNKFLEIGKGSRGDNSYGQSSHVEDSEKALGLRVEVNDNRLNLQPKTLQSQGRSDGHEPPRKDGRKLGDLAEMRDEVVASQSDVNHPQCSRSDNCHSPKTHSERLRMMFPSRRKHKVGN